MSEFAPLPHVLIVDPQTDRRARHARALRTVGYPVDDHALFPATLPRHVEVLLTATLPDRAIDHPALVLHLVDTLPDDEALASAHAFVLAPEDAADLPAEIAIIWRLRDMPEPGQRRSHRAP